MTENEEEERLMPIPEKDFRALFKGLDFSLLTMLSGLSCIIFGFIWLSFGYDVSNIFMAIFFVPFGCFLVILSIWTGLAHYNQWKQYQSYHKTTYASYVQ